MTYTIEKLADAPVIVYVRLPGGDVEQDMRAGIPDMLRLLDSQPEPVFMVFDLREMTIELGAMLQGASMAARGQDALLHHPNIRENVYVITDPLTKMAVQGLTSATFGRVRLSRFDTVEEAVGYCRAQIIHWA